MSKTVGILVKEICDEFSFFGFLFNKLSDRCAGAEGMTLVSYYRPIAERGRDQLKCLKAHIKQWKKTGNTDSYCEICPEFLEMSCMESFLGTSRECRRGHYRFEAT